MREDKLLYFTPAEYILMMELAGDGPYSMLQSDTLEPDDTDFIQAFSTLFRRGMICRKGNCFVLSDKGNFFVEMKQAQASVLLSAPQVALTAICYIGKTSLWLVELADDILSLRYRVRQIDRSTLRRWLMDAAALASPALCEEDVTEIKQFFKDMLSQSEGQTLLRLERYINENMLFSYELLEGKYGQLVVYTDALGQKIDIYTEEKLSQIILDSFREDAV